jgi:ABC-2 type transport system permease protein
MASLERVWVLVAHELRKRWRALLIWGVILGGLGALYVGLYPSMSQLLEDYIKNAPPDMRQYFGDLQGPISIEEWLDTEFLSGLVPVALPFLVIIIGARAIAGNEERKRLDLLLGTPLRRSQLDVGAMGTMALSLAGVLALTWLLTYVAALAAGVGLPPGRLAAALATLWPLCLVFGSLALLLSAVVRRSALAIVIPALILVGMYVIDSLAQVSKSMEPLKMLSLFHHLGRPLEGSFPWTAVLLMLAGTCMLAGLGIWAFSRRDIHT